MNELINLIQPIISGVAGGFFVLWMISRTKKEAPVDSGKRILSYNIAAKLFAVLLIPFTFFICYVVSQSYKGQEAFAFLTAAGFIVAAILTPYQVFFVKFSYDENNGFYWSFLKGGRTFNWDQVSVIDYSKILQMHYMSVDGVGKIWLSNMMDGYEELGDFLSMQFPED